MNDQPQLALALLQQTRVGRRQLATAQVLKQANGPLDRTALIHAVEAQVGAGCYGARPEYTLAADIRALKQAKLPIRYTRAAPHPGYWVPTAEQMAAIEAARLLGRIGWHPAELTQMRVYARMAPARKVAQMLQWRRAMLGLLETRLRQAQPDILPQELARQIQEQLALLQEDRPGA